MPGKSALQSVAVEGDVRVLVAQDLDAHRADVLIASRVVQNAIVTFGNQFGDHENHQFPFQAG